MIGRLLVALAIAAAISGGSAACAQPAAQPVSPPQGAATPAEAQRVIETLQDPQKRADLIRNLEAIAKALPPPATSTTKPATTMRSTVQLAPHGLGAQIIAGLSLWADRLTGDVATAAQTITAFPVLWHWVRGVEVEPDRRYALLNAAWRAAAAIGAGLVLEFLVGLGVARASAVVAQRAPAGHRNDGGPDGAAMNGEWRLLRRLPFALAQLILDLAPIAVFWAADVVIGGLVSAAQTREVIGVVIDAYASSRAILVVGCLFASPASDRLRLLRIGDEQAAYGMRWLRGITLVAVVGAAVAALVGLFAPYAQAAQTLDRLVALVVAIIIGLAVLRSRAAVAPLLRAAPTATGELAGWRNALAAIWHYLALVVIIALWIVWDAGAANGLDALGLLVGSVAIVIAARLAAIIAAGALDRVFRRSLGPPGAASRASRYYLAARYGVMALIAATTIVVLLQFWGADAFDWFRHGTTGARLLSALVTIAVAVIVSIVVWESANARLERRLARLSTAGSAAHAARLRTLLPILRAALLLTVLAVVGLTALSELGINIAPLLAGAGIVGVAVGFGSQKLVQDVIGGMFVLFENAVQVGDWITVAGLSGSVEQLSVRNIWLRGGDGAVHIIPFSAVTSITNNNRGAGNAAISLTVAFSEDTDRVFAALRNIAAEMRGEAIYGQLMLGEPQLWVDAVSAGGIIVAGQIACTDAGRWAVQHEFNRRLQKRLKTEGIALGS